MVDAKTTGQDYGPGYHTPGYGTTIAERMQHYVGRNVIVYVGDDLTPVSGVLHNVGANYLEVHRMGANNAREAIFIPMMHISAVSAPMDGMQHP